MTTVLTQPPPPRPVVTAPAIRLRKVSRVIDERQVLRDVDLEISDGEFVCLIGANGAGKTTLLNLLAALSTPTSGTIELFGKPMTPSVVDLRSRIGLIGHQPMLYRDLSARENLNFFARLYALADPERSADRMIRMVGLADRAAEPIRNFSRGMTQRLSVGRALLHNPSLILADEPFTGLDAPSIESLEILFGQLHDAGKTIVMVNHDIAQSLRIAERAIVLRHGSIAIDQPTHRLYARELLSEVM